MNEHVKCETKCAKSWKTYERVSRWICDESNQEIKMVGELKFFVRLTEPSQPVLNPTLYLRETEFYLETSLL
jgi:hypothetical protein